MNSALRYIIDEDNRLEDSIDAGDTSLNKSTEVTGETLLMSALRLKKFEIAEKLIKGSDLTITDAEDKTALDYAIENDAPDYIIRRLIEYGSVLESKDVNGENVLMRTIAAQKFSTAILLINMGAEIDVKDDTDKNLLIKSVEADAPLIFFDRLIEAGVEIDETDFLERSALTTAVSLRYLDTAEFLIDKGADINVVDFEGKTLLHLMAEKGNLDFSDFIMMEGEMDFLSFILNEIDHDIDDQDDEGETALHKAARSNNIEVYEALIRRGANRLSKNDKGLTPEDILRKSKRDDIRRLTDYSYD